MSFISPFIYGIVYLMVFLFVVVSVSSVCLLISAAFNLSFLRRFAILSKPNEVKRVRVFDWFMAVGSVMVVIFLLNDMFSKFFAYDLNPQQIKLHYFWPKRDVIIPKANYGGFNLDIDRKRRSARGVLVIFVKEDAVNWKMFKSTAFIVAATDTNSIAIGLQSWGVESQK